MEGVSYRVELIIHRLDHQNRTKEKVPDVFECSAFRTLDEAKAFCVELQVNHCACAGGEAELWSEMNAPELFTAGD